MWMTPSSLTYLHVDDSKLLDSNIRIHVEEFVELSHLKEQHSVEVTLLQFPPLLHSLNRESRLRMQGKTEFTR